jgi:hypothetical protein
MDYFLTILANLLVGGFVLYIVFNFIAFCVGMYLTYQLKKAMKRGPWDVD